MNKIKKLHRYVHGLTKDETPFLFLDFFHLEIDETGKIVNGKVSVMIDGKYEVDTLNKLLRHAFPFLYAIGRG